MTEIVIAVGAGLVALSTVLPWISVALFGSMNLFNIYSADGDAPVVPLAVVVSCVVVGLLGLAGKPAMGTAALVLGIIDAVGGSLFVIGAIRAVQSADGLASIGIGPFVAVVGVVILIAAGIKAMREGYR